MTAVRAVVHQYRTADRNHPCVLIGQDVRDRHVHQVLEQEDPHREAEDESTARCGPSTPGASPAGTWVHAKTCRVSNESCWRQVTRVDM